MEAVFVEEKVEKLTRKGYKEKQIISQGREEQDE